MSEFQQISFDARIIIQKTVKEGELNLTLLNSHVYISELYPGSGFAPYFGQNTQHTLIINLDGKKDR